MSNCKICGCKVITSSDLDDVCSSLSCWKKAYPQLFEKALPWNKEGVITTISPDLHELLQRDLRVKKPPLWKYLLFRIMQPFLMLLGVVKLLKMRVKPR